MRTIKAIAISKDNFAPFGTFDSILNPTGNHLGTFYPDKLLFPIAGGSMPVAFSALVSEKPEEMIITAAEYHNTTGEGILALDDDVIIHVAPPSVESVPELTQAFIIPQGTMVKLNTGVWHLAALPVHKDKVHILIVLPERIYMNDCTVVEYEEKDQIKIQL